MGKEWQLEEQKNQSNKKKNKNRKNNKKLYGITGTE